MRYIRSIANQEGWWVIRGSIGVKRYLWYTKREAMKKYNEAARTAAGGKSA